MINRTLYLISCVTVGVFMSSCSIYGPAFQGHQLTYMETPDPDVEPTNNAFQTYAGGSLGTGAIYGAQDKNVGGSFVAHMAWSNHYRESAAGIYAFVGEYKAVVNNVQKSLMYQGLGFKTYQTWIVPISDALSWQMVGTTFALHGEGGNYTHFRDTIRIGGNSIFREDRSPVSPISIVAGVTTGVKIRLEKNQFITARYLFGGSTATLFLSNNAFFHQFTVNYQSKKASIYASIVKDDAGRNGLNTPFQLGVSLPLHFD